MPAYILIDNASGTIWSDTRDLGDGEYVSADLTPVAAARIADRIFNEARVYTEHDPDYRPAAHEGAYHVYRVDLGGSEVVPVVMDGEDQHTIKAVERDCEKVAVVTWRRVQEMPHDRLRKRK